jgi:EAL domain-containing protein (putative c-di-GMP-specific phosphodiesterase class I)
MPGRAWYLETVAEGQLRRFPVAPLPFRVGRQRGLELMLPAESVSKLHAEIYLIGSELRVRDLGSRNGTFLNRVLVEDAALGEGDVLHFADYEFRLCRSARRSSADQAGRLPTVEVAGLAHRFGKGAAELRELLRERRVTVAFQPIVRLSNGGVAGFEALGRGRHPGLPEEPRALFRIAETVDAEAELSRLFRRKAVELAAQWSGLPALFLNTHPAEFTRPGLLESIDELRALAPRLELALEIHEGVLADASAIAALRSALVERRIALVFDNFGTGRARLHELAEAPPHYLKFHQRFVRDLDRAPAGRQRMLESLLTVAKQVEVKTVAEGLETEAEMRACARIGFTFGQGAYIGRPRSIEEMPSRV